MGCFGIFYSAQIERPVEETVMKSKSKRILAVSFLSLIILVAAAYFFRVPILQKAGDFMAPRGEYTADIAILEGADFLHRSIADAGIDLLKSRKVKRLAVVLHNINPKHRPYGYNDDYPEMVRREIRKRGLVEGDFEIIVTHIHNPITLTAAQGAMKVLAKSNIKSAILLAPGFHTRRSYLVYQYAANPYHITIYPQACFGEYGSEKWWTQDFGKRDFAAESAKLAYYLIWGHIPFKLSYPVSE